ncbi:MAG: helix-turn-helix domain-containing protein [Pseudomonadota bacterium]
MPVSNQVSPSPRVKRVRSLGRGLDVLRLLNIRNGLSLTQVVQGAKLPRGTAYRLLNTLIAQGFVTRVEPEGRYYLTAKVTTLSDGFATETWPTDVAKPLMAALCDDVGWPVVLATLFGTSMVVRENTDSLTSMVFNVVKPGYRMPLLGSASGWIYLAFCREEERAALLSSVAYEADDPLRYHAVSDTDMHALLERIRHNKYCVLPQRNIRSSVFSVPILDQNARFLAALSIRYFTSAVTTEDAIAAFTAPMQNCAAAISKAHASWTQKAKPLG